MYSTALHAPGSSPPMVIRAAGVEDAETMVVFLTDLYADPELDTIARRDPPTREEERQVIRRANEVGRAFFLLAFAGEQMIGMLDLWAWEQPEGRHCGRLGMSVAKNWRGRGVGRRLIDEAIARAQRWEGFCRIELEVASWNHRGIGLYERAGFRYEGRRVKSMNLRGEPEDTLVMALVW
jgi:RimJ/RimL family protein N-acetyltransferase